MSERILCLVIGYLCGLLQTSYIYGRLKGIDIREHGSGNAGSTNALRTLGKKAGIITLVGDCGKCMIAVLLSYLLLKEQYPDTIKLLMLYAAAGTILGHNYPFYLGFRGGKGIAATMGLVLSFHPVTAIFGVVIFIATFAITHYVSLGSLLVYVGFVIELIVLGQMGKFHMSQNHLIEMYLLALFLAALAFWRHKENIKRLLQGSENKTFLTKKK